MNRALNFVFSLLSPPEQSPQKEVIINSLREIVEKQPLAKPNPFDPPSPPLSAFLPPPPNSRPVSAPTPQQQAQIEQQQQFALPPLVDQQPIYREQHQPQQHQQTLPQPEQQPLIQYQTSGSSGRTEIGNNEGSTSTYIDAGSSSSSGESGEADEGLAYKTEEVDENGKKVAYVYQRPVQLPDVTRTKFVDTNENSAEDSLGYDRKPLGYEQNNGGEYYGTLSISKPQQDTGNYEASPNGAGPNNDQGFTSSFFSHSSPSGQQDSYQSGGQSQWSGNTGSSDDGNGGKSSIEYGGFRPIKKPSGEYKGSVYNANGSPDSGPPYTESFGQPPPHHSDFQEPPRQQDSGYNGNNNNFEQSYQPEPPRQNFKPPQNKFKFGHFPKLNNFRFKPVHGKEASKKLKELGINEQEFYGTVHKILHKGPFGKLHAHKTYGPKPSAPYNGNGEGNGNRGPNPQQIYGKVHSNNFIDEFDLSKFHFEHVWFW